MVRCLLFEQLSGLPDTLASPSYRPDRELRARKDRFAAQLTPELAAELDRHAQGFLHDHQIRDEPVTWEPPLDLLTGLQLPGPDLSKTDVEAVHRLIRNDGLSVTDAAETLGTSPGAVRHVLRQNPAPLLAPPRIWGKGHAGHFTPTTAALPSSEELTSLYLDQRLSLKTIARRHEVSSPVIARLAHEYGITLRQQGEHMRRHEAISREWLFEEYVTKGRTLPEIARDKGMSGSNMARWAHIHRIPLRPRGGASHRTALAVESRFENVPELLHPALHGPECEQRLLRFAAATAYPSIADAAKELGLNVITLGTQIRHLERDLGQPLLIRAQRRTPMRITPFGDEILMALTEAGWINPARRLADEVLIGESAPQLSE
ncbi:LysR family transcriptional regulator [Kitasatospora sp. GP82]|uniref:helix-turn-helix domain-containing protein n=1 Tax=Kitasatospora sp. GP82 TaxID=3035089 RepID=UPI002473C0EE|nr:LysR family transcriptional regulator [Kitasatospora sp. GP82]MDH6128238.1 transposase-like protein [Kitasatospora sp. GP82]